MSSSLKRMEAFYPDQNTKKLLAAYSKDRKASKSSIITGMLKEKFRSLSEKDRQRLLNIDK